MVSISFDRSKYVFTHIPIMLISSEANKEEKSREIALFLSQLEEYNIVLKDLINYPIDEKQRNLALNIAYYITENTEINNKLVEKKQIPLKELSRTVKISVANLEKLGDYILTYYIILTNLKYKNIQEFLSIKYTKDNKVIELHNKDYTLKKGLVIKSHGKKAFILTNAGEFLKIKTNELPSVGSISEGKECVRIKKFRIHIAILLVLLTMICSGIAVEYGKIERIVVIELSSNIKIHVNKFNKIIYVYSPSEKGQELIKKINIENKDLDYGISEVFREGVEEEMASESNKILMTITGKSIEYGSLTQTQKVVGENKLPVIINNSGTEQNFPTYEPDNE